MTVEPGRCGEALSLGPALAAGDEFPFVCAGCGGCCRKRRDLVLSGYDLYRIARRLYLPPRVVAQAFCKSYIAPQSCLPALRLTPSPETGDCRFLEGGACVIHEARPLACALYPLGQCIDPDTGAVAYHAQLPLCGLRREGRTLRQYLADAALDERAGTDTHAVRVFAQEEGGVVIARILPLPAAERAHLLRRSIKVCQNIIPNPLTAAGRFVMHRDRCF